MSRFLTFLRSSCLAGSLYLLFGSLAYAESTIVITSQSVTGLNTSAITTRQLVSWCEQAALAGKRPIGDTPERIASATACLGYLRGWLDAEKRIRLIYHLPDNCHASADTPAELANQFLKSIIMQPDLKNRPIDEAVYLAFSAGICRNGSTPTE